MVTMQPLEQRAPEQAADRQPSPTPAHRLKSPATPVRMHVEPTESGLAVWLGIDGSADVVAARTAALLDALRRQAALSGGRLSTVTCNGAVAYAAAAALNLKEKT